MDVSVTNYNSTSKKRNKTSGKGERRINFSTPSASKLSRAAEEWKAKYTEKSQSKGISIGDVFNF